MYAIAIITGICLISVFVSYVAFRRGFTRTADDYFVAGSSLGYFVLVFSLLASFLSAFAMFGMSGLGYRTGFGSLFVLTVNLIPLGFLWYFIHRKTFLLGRARKWMSMGAPFGQRYGNGMRAMIPVVVLQPCQGPHGLPQAVSPHVSWQLPCTEYHEASLRLGVAGGSRPHAGHSRPL